MGYTQYSIYSWQKLYSSTTKLLMMKKIVKNILIFLIGIVSLILPIMDRLFFSVVSEHSFFETILAGVVFIVSSLIATILPVIITNPKVFKNNYLKLIWLVPLIFMLILIIQPDWLNILFEIIVFEIVFFPILVVLDTFDMLYFLSPLFFLLIVFLAPYLLSKYVQKSKNRFINILYLILYICINLVITISIWTIIYFE